MLRLPALVLAMAAASPAAAEEVAFTSPSGNIRCLMSGPSGEGLRCDLGVDGRSFARPPAGCEGDWGTAFALGRRGPGRPICADAPLATPGARVLSYGALLSWGGITCRSEEDGMTCTNEAGGGFSLSRARQRVF